ncbi:receptor-type guanylate cyclase gcy-7-like [Paramacrobiotus metropolitanus]|uniref:receptor-type guanylate cyclase gcy-7-like n=1 Tax=Paramacrobiotus metropolitanus TaxID=2943436 RepID=UPI002445F394|nr:receptor-type guanylate cyclase gcy-7-like [Paramacrobiotus metropolitanus]
MVHLICVCCFLISYAGPVIAILNISFVFIGRIAPATTYGTLPFIGPAMSIGIEYVQQKYAGTLHCTLDFLYAPLRPGYPPPELADTAVQLAAEWHYTKRKEGDITIYIISGVVEAVEIPHFMRQWNTLWISTLSVTPQITDRVMNPAWIAVNDFSTTQCARLYIEILTKYRWTTVYVIIDPGDPSVFMSIAAVLLKELGKQSSIRYIVQRIKTKGGGSGVAYGAFESVLKDVAVVSRVVIFFGHAFFLRELLITAERMGMTDGEYVYMALETMHNKPVLGDFNWQHNDENDQIVFRAYQSLLLVQPKYIDVPPNLQLGTELIRRSARDYNLTYNISDQNFPNLVSSYWAVVATTSLINESLSRADDMDYQDGKALARLFPNHTYTDEYGSLYVDSTGQRRTDLAVTYFTSSGIRTTLLTKAGVQDTLNEVAHLTEWASARTAFPPPNEPVCGYLKNKCLKSNESLWIIVSTCLGIAVVGGTFGVFYWRYNKQKEAERLLHDPWWQLHLDDVKATSYFRSNASSLFTGQLHTESDSDSFKALRRIEHQNIGQFYGLSIGRRGAGRCDVFVVFACPPRGSLPQVCCSAIGKDFTFTSSFVMDFLEVLIGAEKPYSFI